VSKRNQIIVFLGQTYRLRVAKEECELIIILEEYIKPYWQECQKWDDPGHLANMMVKQGTVADHAEALTLLNNVLTNGNG
jgi:hypothetical protein